MPTDLHTHYLPIELAARLRQRQTAPRIETLPDGSERLHMPAGSLAFTAAYVDMDARIAFMDRLGVRRQLLSLPGLFGIDSLPFELAAPLTRLFNDDLAELCRRRPGRFIGLASLPLADIDAAVAELRRGRRELGLIGAILPVNAFASLAEAERIRPLFSVAQELAAHIFLHPGPCPGEVSRDPKQSVAADNALARRALDVQARLAQAMVTLLFTDFLDPYPDVSLHIANLGGTLPMVIERMDHTAKLRAPEEPLPSSRVRRLYVDCASLGPRAIELAVAVYGADRIVLGSDCPIFRADWTLGAVREANLSETQREAIVNRNAAALLARFLS